MISRSTLLQRGQTVARIVHRAKLDYVSSEVAQSTSCKQLLNVCDKLRGCRPDSPLPATFPRCELPVFFCEYFVRKVKMIRDELDSQKPLLNSPTDDLCTDSSFCAFQPVSTECVRKIIFKSPLKTCLLDPIPTSLCVESTASRCDSNYQPVLADCQTVFKEAIVKPLLKKPSLDQNSLKNYRPVSNLSFVSQITENIVLSQLSISPPAISSLPSSSLSCLSHLQQSLLSLSVSLPTAQDAVPRRPFSKL